MDFKEKIVELMNRGFNAEDVVGVLEDEYPELAYNVYQDVHRFENEGEEFTIPMYVWEYATECMSEWE